LRASFSAGCFSALWLSSCRQLAVAPGGVSGGVGFGVVVGRALVLPVREPGLPAVAVRFGVIGLYPSMRRVTSVCFASASCLDVESVAHPLRKRSGVHRDVDQAAFGVEDVTPERGHPENREDVFRVNGGAVDQFAAAINIVPFHGCRIAGFDSGFLKQVLGDGLRHHDVDQRRRM